MGHGEVSYGDYENVVTAKTTGAILSSAATWGALKTVLRYYPQRQSLSKAGDVLT